MENKLMMKLLVGTETMFFLSLIMAFVYFSILPGFKPQREMSLDIQTTGIFTAVLFLSSFTYWRVEVNYNKGRIKNVKIWLLATILLGAIFLAGQGNEYVHLFEKHISIGTGIFGTAFFTLTGFHGLHVFIGLIILSVVTLLTFLGDFNQSKSTVISTVGIYWHFVDIVWAFVFTIVYILPRFY